MAFDEHVKVFSQGRHAWAEWRNRNPDVRPCLDGLDLSSRDMSEWNLRNATLTSARIHRTDFRGANLAGCDLFCAEADNSTLDGADLTGASLVGARPFAASVVGTDFSGADLSEVDFTRANLTRAKFDGSIFSQTVLGNAVLSEASGLETCRHDAFSVLDHFTLRNSWPLPETFLRGCGLEEEYIRALPQLLGSPVRYRFFISYSARDDAFARKLYGDLQRNGVRCWFAPESIRGGRKLHEQIGHAIGASDRVLLILSRHSMSSEWVRTEIARARQKEIVHKRYHSSF